MKKNKKDTKPISQLVGTLESALDEDMDEFRFFEKDEKKEEKQKKKGDKPNRAFIVIGIFVLVFSVIGFIASCDFVIDFAENIRDKTALKEEFALFLYPVVLNDPPAFDNIQNLPSSSVISSAIWRIILSSDTSHYENTMGFITVPAIDIEASARNIFGTGFDINHQTVDFVEITFEYREDLNSYIVPASPSYMSYTPVITEISNVGELYKVRVEYHIQTPLSMVSSDYESEAMKTMLYTVSRTTAKMTINSLEYVASGGNTY